MIKMMRFTKYSLLILVSIFTGCVNRSLPVAARSGEVTRIKPRSFSELVDIRAGEFATDLLKCEKLFGSKCAASMIAENPEQAYLASLADKRVAAIVGSKLVSRYKAAEYKIEKLIQQAKTADEKDQIRSEVFKIIKPLKALSLADDFEKSYGVLSETTLVKTPAWWYKSCANWAREIGLNQYSIKYATKGLVASRLENDKKIMAAFHLILARNYRTIKQYDLARYHAERAIDSQVNTAEGFKVLGDILFDLNRKKHAFNAYKIANSNCKKNSPEQVRILLCLVNLAIAEGNVKYAQSTIKELKSIADLPAGLLLKIDVAEVIASSVANPSRENLVNSDAVMLRAAELGDYKFCKKYAGLFEVLKEQYRAEHMNIKPKIIDDTRELLLPKKGKL